MNRKQLRILGIVGALIMIIGLSMMPAQAQDVSKLIRIKPDDSWMYLKTGDKGTSKDTYNVTEMTIVNQKELNIINTNSTSVDYFTTNWKDGGYGFITNDESFTLYNDARGNFIGLVEGTDIIDIYYPTGVLNINRSGTLWERTSVESVNQAIVTGEPRTVVYEFHKSKVWYEGGQERKEILDISLQYLAYPHDPQTVIFNSTQTPVVNITFSLDQVQVICDYNDGITDVWFDVTFDYAYLEYPTHVTYTYAGEIGLPIEIQTINTSKVSVGMGAMSSASYSSVAQSIKLVNYNVDNANISGDSQTSDSNLPFTTTTTAPVPIGIVGVLIALPILLLRRKQAHVRTTTRKTR